MVENDFLVNDVTEFPYVAVYQLHNCSNMNYSCIRNFSLRSCLEFGSERTLKSQIKTK